MGELGVPFEHHEAGVKEALPGEAAYLSVKNALAVPLMDDDGFVLWEGNAIVRYLAQKYGAAPFWPADPQVRADADRWMDYQLSTVRVHVHPLMRETPDAEQVAYHSRKLAETISVVEHVLEDRQYLTGADFTVGDIPLGIVTFRWFILDIERPAMPNVEAWYDRLSRRPAFQQHICPPVGAFTALR